MVPQCRAMRWFNWLRRFTPILVVHVVLAETLLTPRIASPLASAPVATLSQLTHEAEAGSADAQLELALAFEDGRLCKPDPAQAVRWYQSAAAQGVGVAHLRLGALFESGAAGGQSYAEARTHYESAVALGVPEANLRLGILHLEGWGVARDPVAAEAFIEKAAVAGYRPAQLVLSDMFAAGIGVKSDRAKAIAWADQAAKAKDPEGEFRLGVLALKRNALQADVQLAREWYQLSAEQEYSRGMLEMARTFFRPGHTAEDERLGTRWLQLAADNGSSAAAFYLAGFLLTSTATAEEVATGVRAHALFEQSAKAGEGMAGEVLELNKGGWTLKDAFQHVTTMKFTDRYVERYAAARQKVALDLTGSNQPLPVKLVQPVTPQAMRLTGTTGQVVVDFLVDTTGRVRNPHAVSSTHPAFTENAVASVKQWVFVPGRKNGQPVNTHMQVPVVFTLSQVYDGGPTQPGVIKPNAGK